MASERACEVRERFGSKGGFWAWCGKKWSESRPDDGSAPACRDCVKAKAKAEKAAAEKVETGGGGLWAWLTS